VTEQKEPLHAPCPYMIFDPNGYHTCELMPTKAGFCCCAWFYDLGNPTWHVELSINPKTKKVGAISTFDFPNSEEYKDFRERTTTEDDVSKICPCGYTFHQIDRKIEILNNRLRRQKPTPRASKEASQYG